MGTETCLPRAGHRALSWRRCFFVGALCPFRPSCRSRNGLHRAIKSAEKTQNSYLAPGRLRVPSPFQVLAFFLVHTAGSYQGAIKHCLASERVATALGQPFHGNPTLRMM